MEEIAIGDTTHDEYGQRANGVLWGPDKFDSVFGHCKGKIRLCKMLLLLQI